MERVSQCEVDAYIAEAAAARMSVHAYARREAARMLADLERDARLAVRNASSRSIRDRKSFPHEGFSS